MKKLMEKFGRYSREKSLPLLLFMVVAPLLTVFIFCKIPSRELVTQQGIIAIITTIVSWFFVGRSVWLSYREEQSFYKSIKVK